MRTAPARGGLADWRDFIAPAQAADVVSSNIVGYQKVTLTEKLTLLGTQFVQVGGSTKDIQELLNSDNNLPGLDEEAEFQSKLLVWEDGGYTTYGWYSAKDGEEQEWPEAASKWVLNDQSDLAKVDFSVGTGFWLMTPGVGSPSVTISGEVPSSDSISISIPNAKEGSEALTLISNPYPKSINIQDIQLGETFPGLDAEAEFQTKLLIWEDGGYTTFGWYSAQDGEEQEWAEAASKWVLNDQSDLATTQIEIGQGFWIISTGKGTLTFTK